MWFQGMKLGMETPADGEATDTEQKPDVMGSCQPVEQRGL